MELYEGALLGRYTLVSRYASGGMADIWLANAAGASGFKKVVILKILQPQIAEDPDNLRMFLNEALVGSALNHPNIVHVFDYGEIGETYFIAMEYVSGKTLRSIKSELRKKLHLPPVWLTLRTVSMVCDALDYAYQLCDIDGVHLHLAHRDITPENIMVSYQGIVKVLDFGIARLDCGQQTEVGKLKGKRAYVAPEQILAVTKEQASNDHRSDLFSLGVVLYEMLTGTRPFQGKNELSLLKEIIEKHPVSPRQLAPSISPALEAIVLKALQKEPDQRYQSAAEFRDVIEEFNSTIGYKTERHIAQFMADLFGETDPLMTTTPTPIRITIAPSKKAVAAATECVEFSIVELDNEPASPGAVEPEKLKPVIDEIRSRIPGVIGAVALNKPDMRVIGDNSYEAETLGGQATYLAMIGKQLGSIFDAGEIDFAAVQGASKHLLLFSHEDELICVLVGAEGNRSAIDAEIKKIRAASK
jgi:serine/threonine-protein kinase